MISSLIGRNKQEQIAQTLFIGPSHIIIKNTKNNSFYDVQRVIEITFEGAYLYNVPIPLDPKQKSNIESDKHLHTIQELQNPQTQLSIQSVYFPYLVEPSDPYLHEYLTRLSLRNITPETSLVLLIHESNNTMTPIIFSSRSWGYSFCRSVLVYQLFKEHYKSSFSSPNLSLLNHIAQCCIKGQYCVDPDILTQKHEQEQLKIMKHSFELLINRSQKFKIEIVLKFKIMDEVSVKYYHDLFSTEILSQKLTAFQASNCFLSENKTLADVFMLFKNDTRSSLNPLSKSPYSLLQHLSLSHNYLTDDCFRVLIRLSKTAIWLKKIDLSHNRIKLNIEPTNQIVSSRLSMRQSGLRSNEESPFISFLFGIRTKLSQLYLDYNLIENIKFIIQYLIEAVNTPIHFLSIRNNKLSQLSKIKLIKSWVEDRRERVPQIKLNSKGLSQSNILGSVPEDKKSSWDDYFEQFVMNVGKISIVDKDIEWYQVSLLKISKKYGFLLSGTQKQTKPQINSFSSIPICISKNPQWEICDPSDLKLEQVEHPRRKSSFLLNSRSASQLSLGRNSPPINSAPEPLNQTTFRAAIQKLEKGYNSFNYAQIRIQKELLQQYNEQLYKVRIKPKFSTQQKHLESDKNQLLKQTERIFNLCEPEADINHRLDLAISHMFRRRLNFEVFGFHNQPKVQGQQQQIILDGNGNQILQSHSSNAFSALIYLKSTRDALIQEYINTGRYRDIEKIIRQLQIFHMDIYREYYRRQFELNREDSIAYQSYRQLASIHELELQRKKGRISVSLNVNDNYAINLINRYQFLLSQNSKEDQQINCLMELLLFPTKFIRNYQEIDTLLKDNKLNLHKSFPFYHPFERRSNQINFITQYDVINNCPFGPKNLNTNDKQPKFPESLLPEDVTYQQLEQFSITVNNFLIFLYHCPDRILAETMQYLDYIFGQIIEQPGNRGQIYSNQFYLQLLSYPYSKLRVGILGTIIEYSSMHTRQSEILEPYIEAFWIKNEPQKQVSFVRLKDQNGNLNVKIQKKKQKITEQLVQHITQQLTMIFEIKIWVMLDVDQYSYAPHPKFYRKPIKLSLHLFTTITQLYYIVLKTYGTMIKRSLEPSHYWLYLFDPTNQQAKLLNPTIANNIYELLNKNILSFTKGSLPDEDSRKSILILKPIIYPLKLYDGSLTHNDSWYNYYLQIKYNYRHFGNLLTMIETDQSALASVISQCIICQFLWDKDLNGSLQKFVESENFESHNIEGFIMSILQRNFFDHLANYVPYGTKSVLNSIHYQLIKLSFLNYCKGLIVKLSDINFMKQFEENVYLFVRKCGLIGEAIELSDGINQQLFIGNTGIMHVERLFTVVALKWREIVNIRLRKSQYSLQLVVAYRKMNEKTKTVEQKKQLVIEEYIGTGMFLRSAIVIIHEYLNTIIKTNTEQVYQFVSECENPNTILVNIKDNKRISQILQNMMTGGSKQIREDRQCIMDKLDKYIEYTKEQSTNLDEYEFKKGEQEKQKYEEQYRKSMYSNNSSGQRRDSVQSSSEHRNSLNKVQNSEYKRQTQQIQEQKITEYIEHPVINNEDKPPSKILDPITPINESHQNNQINAFLNPKPEQQLIVTNTRRSSRRQLPKRRSSRQR